MCVCECVCVCVKGGGGGGERERERERGEVRVKTERRVLRKTKQTCFSTCHVQNKVCQITHDKSRKHALPQWENPLNKKSQNFTVASELKVATVFIKLVLG